LTIGLFFTLTLITYTLAQPVAADVITAATCLFGQEAFLGFVGSIDVGIDATANKVTAKGKVNNNAAKRWAPMQKHGVQVRSNSNIAGSCANVGDVFEDWKDATTDVDANLVFDFDQVSANADPAKFGGRTLVILRNDSSVAANANAIVACCVITLTAIPTPMWVPATPPLPPPQTTVAWPYSWPQGWTPPPGCAYIPASYVDYQKTTTTTTTTTTTYYVATTAPPPPPPTTAYDPYAPNAPPPPPPTTTVYYAPPVTTTTKATTAGYCWNCPMPDSYGNWPPVTAYYYQPCQAVATTGTACVPSYYQKCPASQSVLALFAALVALFALLF